MNPSSNSAHGDFTSVMADSTVGVRLLERLLEVAADALLVIDSAMIIRRCNPATGTIFGYDAADLIGRSIDQLIPHRFVKAHHRHVDHFAHGDADSLIMGGRSEIVGLRQNGEEFPAEATISRLSEGGETFYLVILRDTTARKQLEEDLRRSEERFRQVFNYSNDAIFIIDPNESRFVDVNPKACQMFGYARDEFNGLTIADIHPSDSKKFEVFAKSVISQGVGWTDELTCLTKSGDSLPTEVSASIIETGGKWLMVAIFRDISRRKQVEQMQQAFVSNVSHELRTPITSIKIYHELLRRNNGQNNEEYLERLSHEIGRLQHLIDDLLTISNLDQGSKQISNIPVDLNRLIQRYVDDRTILAESQGLSLTANLADDLPAVYGDERLLGQTLSILLTNAFNYTPAGGRVQVSTATECLNGRRWACFRVSDNGMGIHQDEREHLFERFYRGSAGEESGAPGTGLGLSIAREIITRHTGEIHIGDTGLDGKGTSFTVFLPTEA